jgi:hypothetical protein
VLGWGSVSVVDGELRATFGHVDGAAAADDAYRRELDAELERMRVFLGLGG